MLPYSFNLGKNLVAPHFSFRSLGCLESVVRIFLFQKFTYAWLRISKIEAKAKCKDFNAYDNFSIKIVTMQFSSIASSRLILARCQWMSGWNQISIVSLDFPSGTRCQGADRKPTRRALESRAAVREPFIPAGQERA